ncbi:MAG: HNH endonuclease family protein [Ilumatobacteraceae bacterium]|nr:HNH endonuclease family protein [Ilumatobacteraceae bacterium]MDP4976991.1 HNH endonuclease family protein [Ilumatobacteraceae bacterium]
MESHLSKLLRPGFAVSMLFVVASCGSSPSDVVAIEVDNSISVENTESTSSTAAASSTLAVSTTQVVVTSVPATSMPITTAPTISGPTTPNSPAPITTTPTTPVATSPTPTTQPPTTQPQTTQPPAPSDPVGLRIEPEYVGGYDRDLFADWYDADRNGCNTRKEVLIAESLDPVQIGSGCTITGGRWFSIYDNVETTDSSKFDIDHMVPLSEAWGSGAWNWNADQRKHFANDLDQPFFLIAVTASSNRSKSDRDPAEWMPPNSGYHCEYVRVWIEIKRAWDLSVDQAEHNYLAQKLASC